MDLPRERGEGRMPDRFGRFRILGGLPSDGTREAFLAVGDEGKKVVLEVFGRDGKPVPPDGPVARAATAYARLVDPRLVRALEVLSVGGQLAVVREFVEGTTLDVLRAGFERKQHSIGASTWVYVVSCVFEGLAAAHGAQDKDGLPAPVLHGRLDPSSIHVAWDGAVRLGNFNLGFDGSQTTESSRVRRVVGRYLAPEQLKLQPVGPAADVYSATLLLWELLTGGKATDLRATRAGGAAAATPSAVALEALARDIDTVVRDVIAAGLEQDPPSRTLGAARASELLRSCVDVGRERRVLADAIASLRSPRGPVGALPSTAPRARTSSAGAWAEEAPTAVSQRPPALSNPPAQPPAATPGPPAIDAPLRPATAPDVQPTGSSNPPRSAFMDLHGDLQRWFDTIRPPPPSLLPPAVRGGYDRSPQRDQRRRIGWIALGCTASLGLVIVMCALVVALRSNSRRVDPSPIAGVQAATLAAEARSGPPMSSPASQPGVAPLAPAPEESPGSASPRDKGDLERSSNVH